MFCFSIELNYFFYFVFVFLFLCVSQTLSSIRCVAGKEHFFHSVDCLFTALIVSPAVQKLFRFHLLIVALNARATSVLLRRPSKCLWVEVFFPTFSSNRFRAYQDFGLRSLIHLEFSFVQGKRQKSSFVLQQVYILLAHLRHKVNEAQNNFEIPSYPSRNG